MRNVLIVGLGGFVGAMLRYAVCACTARFWGTTFPLGTLLVNIAGCFIIGIVMGYHTSGNAISASLRLFLIAGILGGFTTFSAFGYESVNLAVNGHFFRFAGNILLHIFVGFSAVYAGIKIASRICS